MKYEPPPQFWDTLFGVPIVETDQLPDLGFAGLSFGNWDNHRLWVWIWHPHPTRGHQRFVGSWHTTPAGYRAAEFTANKITALNYEDNGGYGYVRRERWC